MFSLKYETEITVSNIPIQWIPKIELYYPDLPQFPIMYLHSFLNQQRVLGIPVSVSYKISGTSCIASFIVLTNVAPSPQIVAHLNNEIKERIGLSQAITEANLISFCNNNVQYMQFFKELWKYIEASYGSRIPYGRFYEEIYSIVRFVSAWTPKTGRQSEMRMLYNFMSAFGELAELPRAWAHLECYYIPSLSDIRNNTLSEFPKFQRMLQAIEKTFKNQYTNQTVISGHTFNVLPSAWPKNKDDFINSVTLPLRKQNVLSDDERRDVETLVDAFNRHSWRAAYFISALITAKQDDYYQWDKPFFVELYSRGNELKGYSEKVMACFLQQGFIKDEFIPIDTWIETFYQFSLGINTREDFYNSFDHLGKIERVIWLASQANKTNMKNFYDILWCQRFGTIGNKVLRGINPIACSECSLKSACVGLSTKLSNTVILTNNPNVSSFQGASISTVNSYLCVLENNIPKKVYCTITTGKGKNKKYEWLLIDEFSGYIMTKPLSSALVNKGVISMREFINDYKNVVFSKS